MPDLLPLPKHRSKLPDAPSERDLKTLLAHATGWLHPAIAIAAFAGLRMGEVRALEVRDIDLERGAHHGATRTVGRRARDAKSGHERIVPIAQELRPILEEAVRLKMPKARLVTTRRGTTPSRQHVLGAFKRVEEQQGMRGWSFHSLRHYFCSTLIRKGASLEAVRLLAGRSKLDITQRYVHATGDDLVDAIACF
jgi:integrase